MFPQIPWLKIKISKKLRHSFVDERALIATTLISSCHWKTLVPFCLQDRRPENTKTTKLYRKTNYVIQNYNKLAI